MNALAFPRLTIVQIFLLKNRISVLKSNFSKLTENKLKTALLHFELFTMKHLLEYIGN